MPDNVLLYFHTQTLYLADSVQLQTLSILRKGSLRMLIYTVGYTFPYIEYAIVARVNEGINVVFKAFYYALFERLFHIKNTIIKTFPKKGSTAHATQKITQAITQTGTRPSR